MKPASRTARGTAVTFFERDGLHALLRDAGFSNIEDLGAADIAVRYFGVRRDDASPRPGPHLLRARRV